MMAKVYAAQRAIAWQIDVPRKSTENPPFPQKLFGKAMVFDKDTEPVEDNSA